MSDFTASPAGQCLLVSVQYLQAAHVLSEAQRTEGKALFLPTLALAGQGLELLLKSCMHWNSAPPPTRGPAGHAVKDFWELEVCEPIRGHIFVNAQIALEEAKRAGVKPTDGLPEGDPITLIAEYVLVLARLHGEHPYPLRYPTIQSTVAPRTPWMVSVLHMTAQDFLKRPEGFKLARFRGEQP